MSSRAISRRQEGTLVILPVTAAIAVAVFGAGVYDSAATWRTSVAATASPARRPGPHRCPWRETDRPDPRIDPDGEWVMTAAEVPATRGPTSPSSTADRLATGVDLAADLDAGSERRGGRRQHRDAGRRAVPRSPAAGSRSPSTTRPGRRQAARGRGALRHPRRPAPRSVYLGPFPAGRAHARRAGARPADGCPLEGMTLGGGAGTTMQMKGSIRLVDDRSSTARPCREASTARPGSRPPTPR